MIKEITSLLVKLNLQNRSNFKNKVGAYTVSPLAFLREHCTVKVFAGRQIGQTTAVVDLYNDEKSIFVFPFVQMARDFKGSLNIENVTHKSELLRKGFNREYDYIIVDCAFTFSDKEMRTLYELIARKMQETTIILIG